MDGGKGQGRELRKGWGKGRVGSHGTRQGTYGGLKCMENSWDSEQYSEWVGPGGRMPSWPQRF